MTADVQRRPGRSALSLGVLGFLGLSCGLSCAAADAAVRIDGQVQAGGGVVAGSTVTLWAGSAGDPKQTCADQNCVMTGASRSARDGNARPGREPLP